MRQPLVAINHSAIIFIILMGLFFCEKLETMSLENEIKTWRNEIRTDNYAMSIGEWISLYESGELDIHPEFQRFYRWDKVQKSNLIESILLGIPIPPIFVSQRKDGIWDVVDGLQRLSTIFEFVGVLKDDSGNSVPGLTLEKTKYLPSLEGKKWESSDGSGGSLSQEQKLLIKRSKLSVSIILRESDTMAKFELFQRLNTGGSSLTSQEVRNCILVMLDKSAYEWLRDLSSEDSFQECISLSDKNLIEQYDMELALRFIIFSTLDMEEYDKSSDVGEFLTSKMIEIFSDDSFNRGQMSTRFKTTFETLRNTTSEDSFRRYSGGKFKGGFLLTPFEVIAFGIGFNYQNLPNNIEIVQKIKDLHTNSIYVKWSGSGVRANSRLPHLIPLGREIFKG